MGEAARLVDAVAHRHAGGRWLATGGGGYDVYRVVPRTWSLVWLAGAHRDVPARDARPTGATRWAAEAARYGQAPLPATFDDPPNAGEPVDAAQDAAERRSTATSALVRRRSFPGCSARLAIAAGGIRSAAAPAGADPPTANRRSRPRGTPTILPVVDARRRGTGWSWPAASWRRPILRRVTP